MPDAHMRDLERNANEDPASAAELLRARLRAGELTQGQLERAAQVGHLAARSALTDPPPLLSAAALFREAPSWGWRAVTRALLAVALSPRNARVLAGYHSPLYRHALSAALAVLEVESDDTRAAAHQVGRVDVPFTFETWRNSQEGLYALCAARCAAVRDREDLSWTWSESLHAMLDPQLLGLEGPWDARASLAWVPLSHDTTSSVADRLARATALQDLLRQGVAESALERPLPVPSADVDLLLDALRAR